MLVASNSPLPPNNFDAPLAATANSRQARLREILALGLTARAAYQCFPGAVPTPVTSAAAVASGGTISNAALGPATDAQGQAGATLDSASVSDAPVVVPMNSTPSVAAQQAIAPAATSVATVQGYTPTIPGEYNPPGYAGLNIPAGTSSSPYPSIWDPSGYEPGEMSPVVPLSAGPGIPKRRARQAAPVVSAPVPAAARDQRRAGLPWGAVPVRSGTCPAAPGNGAAAAVAALQGNPLGALLLLGGFVVVAGALISGKK